MLLQVIPLQIVLLQVVLLEVIALSSFMLEPSQWIPTGCSSLPMHVNLYCNWIRLCNVDPACL